MPGFAMLQSSPAVPSRGMGMPDAEALAQATEPARPIAACAVDDLDLLLGAVQARLQQLVLPAAASTVATQQLRSLGDVGDWRASVADCAAALAGLQREVQLREAALQRRLSLVERQLARQQAQLAQAQKALALVAADARQAQQLANTDELTALPNRACFQARLSEALRIAVQRRPQLALLLLDLDDFKPINDRHGHAAGDEVLRIVATRLRHAVRAGDLVGRLGGDEFACLLTLAKLADRDQIAQLARKLMLAVAAPMRLQHLPPGVVLRVRPSIGIVVGPADGDNAAALLRHADAAMYRAKRSRIGPLFYDAAADG